MQASIGSTYVCMYVRRQPTVVYFAVGLEPQAAFFDELQGPKYKLKFKLKLDGVAVLFFS
jgi:hypothetical protein